MTEDTSPDNLRKFLESEDPAMVQMGLSMAKGVQKPKDYHHTLVQTLQRLLTENVFDNSAMVMMGLSIVETIEIPEELFPHLAILTFDLPTGNLPQKSTVEEIRNRAEDIANANDIPYGFAVNTDFWSLGNADLIVKHLEQTEGLWGWFSGRPDSNDYYELRVAIETFPWKSNSFSDDGERAEKLLKGILDGGDLYDLKEMWRKHWGLDHGLILQETAEEALVKLGKMNPEDSVWGCEWLELDEYVREELKEYGVSELREKCKNFGVKVSGTKIELMERLLASHEIANNDLLHG